MRSDPGSGLVVQAFDETAGGGVDLDRWCQVARATLEAEGAGTGQLDLIFVDPDDMTGLNREHMGQDRPTDVLAFPLDGPEAGAEVAGGPEAAPDHDLILLDGPPRHLGDVIVCPDVARLQAPDHCGGYEAELTLLVVHGVLHVLGHDHAEDSERLVMQARERHHLKRHGFGHPVPV